MALNNGLLIAQVTHQRLFPKKHGLRYTVYYLSFPLAKMRQLAGKIVSLEHFNLFGFYEKDHGFGGMACQDWINSVLVQWDVPQASGKIMLVTMPRVLGYAFNPVSFWFCLDDMGAVRAVVSEVNNTFKERHAYICFHNDRRPIHQDDWLEAKKVFHVSPFFKVQGHYLFRFAYSEQKIGVWIDYYDENRKVLTTSLVGTRKNLNDANLLACFFRYPMMTLKVISLIHYHALRLMIKGIRYHNKPSPPTEEITR